MSCVAIQPVPGKRVRTHERNKRRAAIMKAITARQPSAPLPEVTAADATGDLTTPQRLAIEALIRGERIQLQPMMRRHLLRRRLIAPATTDRGERIFVATAAGTELLKRRQP